MDREQRNFQIQQYDKLDDQTKKLFRENNLDYYDIAWKQCEYLYNSREERISAFKKLYNSL